MAGIRIPTGLLGSTGLTVSRIGLGLAALGRPAYINLGRQRDLGADRSVAEMEKRCHEMLDAAYAAGVRYVDAARSYGMAENFLGTWLNRRKPAKDSITIGSKWGYTYVGSWRLDAPVHEVKDLSIDTLRRQIVESRSAIGDRLRLYEIHSATLESRVLDDVTVLRELLHLQSAGLVIGLTVTGPHQSDVIRRALHVSIDGVNPFQVVQATWNLLEHSAADALSEAKACGLGVIIKEALAKTAGSRTEPTARIWQPSSAKPLRTTPPSTHSRWPRYFPSHGAMLFCLARSRPNNSAAISTPSHSLRNRSIGRISQNRPLTTGQNEAP